MRIRIQEGLCAFEYARARVRFMRARMADENAKHPVLLHNLGVIMGARGWDQNALADEVEATQGTVSRWGKQSVPRGDTLTRLAAIAQVTPTALLEQRIDEIPSGPLVLPSGRKLHEMMEALLDAVGLSHLVDEYAEALAQLLPAILARSISPVRGEETASQRRRGDTSPSHAR